MKKSSKTTTKKPATEKRAAKKSSTKPKRRAEQHTQLAQVVTRLEIIADKLAQSADHLAELATSHPEERHEESPRQDERSMSAHLPRKTADLSTAAAEGDPNNDEATEE
jgi:hypothetical protein